MSGRHFSQGSYGKYERCDMIRSTIVRAKEWNSRPVPFCAIFFFEGACFQQLHCDDDDVLICAHIPEI